MSMLRTDPHGGWVNPSMLPRGPNGRALCRRCDHEVPEGRRTFCSNTCVEAWKIRTQPAYVRHKLFDRDHGVCAICHLDGRALMKELEKLDDYVQDRPFKYQRAYDYEGAVLQNARLLARLNELHISVHRYLHRKHQGIWDADHVVAVVEGGGECDLDNYRTLCLSCHHVATTALRRRRARAKKGQAKKSARARSPSRP